MRCKLADSTRERATRTDQNGNESTPLAIVAKENKFLLKSILLVAATMILFIPLLAIVKCQISFVLVNELLTAKEKDFFLGTSSKDISAGSCRRGGHIVWTPNDSSSLLSMSEGTDRLASSSEIHWQSGSRSSSSGALVKSIFPVTFGLAQTVTATSAAPNTTAPASTTRAATADDATQPLYWWVILIAALVSFPILLLSCYFLLMWQQKTLHEYKGKYEEMLKALGENTRRVQDQVNAAKKKRRNEALSGVNGGGDSFSGNINKNGGGVEDEEITDRKGDNTFSLSMRDKTVHPHQGSSNISRGNVNSNTTNNKSNTKNTTSSSVSPQVEMKALDLTFGGKYNDLLDDEFYSLSSFQQRRKGETNGSPSNPQNRHRGGGSEGIGGGAVPIGARKVGERDGGVGNLGASTGRGAVIAGGGGGEEDEAYLLAEQRRSEIREGLLHHGRLEVQHQVMGIARSGGGGGGGVARPPSLLLNTIPSRNAIMRTGLIVGEGVGGRAGDGARSSSASGALAKSSGSFVRSSQSAYIPPSRVAAMAYARNGDGEIDDMDLLPSSPSPLINSRRMPPTNAGGGAAVRTSASASAYDPLSLESIAADTAAAHRTLQELRKSGPLRHLESLI